MMCFKKSMPPCLLRPDAPASLHRAYAVIRSNLLARVGLSTGAEQTGAKRIGLSTVSEGAGRAYLAANLAISLSAAGLRVLLVSADYRKADTLSPLLGVVDHAGLAACVVGQGVVPAATAYPGLSYLPAGVIEGEGADFISRPAFASALEKLEKGYDILLLALPAFTTGADAICAAPALQGMLLGAAPGHDRRADVTAAIAAMQQAGLPLYGVVACHA